MPGLARRLRALCDIRGVALLVVEHDRAFLAGIADRTLALSGGRIEYGA